MRTPFAESVIEELLNDGAITRTDSVITVCAGEREREIFSRYAFQNIMITGIDSGTENRFQPFDWSHQDAHDLEFDDGSFDFAFVADGLHHCSSPHQALLEMYRVSRKGIIVIESRDSALMRVANRLGLSPEYELEAVIGCDFEAGGVNDTAIPNFIYRWTESDFKKAIKSFDPRGDQTFRFFYGLNLPYELAGWKKSSLKSNVIAAADPVLRVFTRVFKKQCNTLGMVALKPRSLWPWLTAENGRTVFNREYAVREFKDIEGSGLAARPRESTPVDPSDDLSTAKPRRD
jgi:SAM-dependent methyltransferase